MYQIVIQYATDKSLAPKPLRLRRWAKKTLAERIEAAEITIRIVDVQEMSMLNATYRHKNGPTNVLSFPFAISEEVEMDIPILGDIVICADVVNQEAQDQGKEREAHWAHMIVHGVFHLLGFDHETDEEAHTMESLEIAIMQSLGFDNPYHAGENFKHYE
jgi:probable rRNA maturation factor